MEIIHHGGFNGVTGSCHELRCGSSAILVDCGLFQGAESPGATTIEFEIGHIQALLITHCHIDHIGRIPWLLAAGFRQPIYATEATASLLPLLIDDALKIQHNLNQSQRRQFISIIKGLLRPVPFDCKAEVVLPNGDRLKVIFRQAGHIIGSAIIEVVMPDDQVVVFSGDLGPSDTPLLVDPVSPIRADVLVMESTYGNRKHQREIDRSVSLKNIIKQSLLDGGAIVIPAFAVGRTQELLYDIEGLIVETFTPLLCVEDQAMKWQELPVVLDSPLAAEVNEHYEMFQRLWNQSAKAINGKGRHPLSFEQCHTIDSHTLHLFMVNRLKSTQEPAIVVAASGMCSGGRILNYLEALLPQKCTDVVFVGYQAEGTLGYQLTKGAKQVELNGRWIEVNARIHILPGYSAHADQQDLVNFVTNIPYGPEKIHLVHGEYEAQVALASALRRANYKGEVVVAAEENVSVACQ